MKRILGYGVLVLFGVFLIWYWNCLPDPLFQSSYSTVVLSRDGELLGARISKDEQWRFPAMDSLPQEFVEALVSFEDKRYYAHKGIDFMAVGRALVQNIRERRVVSGASTISMQVIRLAHPDAPRSIIRKFYEAILALRLESRYSKEEILRLWATHAPMGGNVVGLEAAAWRYYGVGAHQLSRAQLTALAVLPNAPAAMRPGRNQSSLKSKRDRVLRAMGDQGLLDDTELSLALLEDLPEAPNTLPSEAPHLVDLLHQTSPETRCSTPIDLSLQRRLQVLADEHHHQLSQNQIHNLAILVLDTRTGEVLSYIGNPSKTEKNPHVDMIKAPRSSGSILKPLLYAACLDAGKITPWTLLEDAPVNYRGYSPQNFDKSYSGVTPADVALAKSLNVPAVNLLSEYGVDNFMHLLRAQNFNTVTRSADDYGLSLILGGAEVRLWDVCGAFAQMGRTLIEFSEKSSTYAKLDPSSHEPLLRQGRGSIPGHRERRPSTYSAGAIYHTLNAMRELRRPAGEGRWEQFSSSKPLAWKTGTSYGHRDAWAVGVNRDYTIGIWVGNATGEGRRDLTGIICAAPILFDVLNSLSRVSFFEVPYDDMDSSLVCSSSGMRATRDCPHTEARLLNIPNKQTPRCSYHQSIWLDDMGQRVLKDCAETNLIDTSWFVLSPHLEYYFKKNNPTYASLPAWSPACIAGSYADQPSMAVVYPQPGAEIYLPRGRNSSQEKLVLQAAHARRSAILHWHLNDQYLGSTLADHHMSVTPHGGDNLLTLVNKEGEKVTSSFRVIESEL